MALTIENDKLPPEMKRELERLRKLAQPGTQVVFDGERMQALIVVSHTLQGIELVTPVVVALPVGDVIMFASSAMQVLGPLMFANIGRKAGTQ